MLNGVPDRDTVVTTADDACGCDGQDELKRLITVDEALARIKAHVAPVDGAETVPLGRATGRALTGLAGTGPAACPVVTSAAIRRKPGRCEFRPATLAGFDGEGRQLISFEDATHSGRVARLPQADGLMILPAGAAHLPKGARVAFQPFGQT